MDLQEKGEILDHLGLMDLQEEDHQDLLVWLDRVAYQAVKDPRDQWDLQVNLAFLAHQDHQALRVFQELLLTAMGICSVQLFAHLAHPVLLACQDLRVTRGTKEREGSLERTDRGEIQDHQDQQESLAVWAYRVQEVQGAQSDPKEEQETGETMDLGDLLVLRDLLGKLGIKV